MGKDCPLRVTTSIAGNMVFQLSGSSVNKLHGVLVKAYSDIQCHSLGITCGRYSYFYSH